MRKQDANGIIFAFVAVTCLLVIVLCNELGKWSLHHETELQTIGLITIASIVFVVFVAVVLAIRNHRKRAEEELFKRDVRRKEIAMELQRQALDNEWLHLQVIGLQQNIMAQSGLAAFPSDQTVISRDNAPASVLFPHAPASSSRVTVTEEPQSPLVIPTAPPWSYMANLVRGPEHIVLGYGANGPIFGSIDDLLSTGIIGKPGKGKTTTMIFYVAQLIKIGAQVLIMDPHGAIASLRPLLDYATGKSLQAATEQLGRDLEARLDAYERGQREFTPYLALIDEFVRVAKSIPDIAAVVESIILEGRKVRMYLIISSQAFKAIHFGGSEARDNLSSRMVHYCRDSQARLLGLEKDAIDKYLSLLKGKPGIGVCVLDCDSRDEIELAAIPETTASDVAQLTRDCQYVRLGISPAMGMLPPASDAIPDDSPIPEISENDEEKMIFEAREKRSHLLTNVSPDEKKFILDRYEAKIPRSQILSESGRSHRYYSVIKAVCDEHDDAKRQAR